jgi:hypothetical protein
MPLAPNSGPLQTADAIRDANRIQQSTSHSRREIKQEKLQETSKGKLKKAEKLKTWNQI